ncbi:speckle-type POZ protein-like [Planococcus citri]|uniref:speckle-type POZ protein-like n=1 Tax=Planococcus citri TaxID=170843 RepID=UPI0031F84122
MVYEKYFYKLFESIKPRKKNKKPNPKSDCLPTEIQHHTTTQIHKVNFTWTIDELDFHITKKEFLKSPRFSAITNEECKWRLVCLPYDKLHRPNSDNLVSIYACLFFIPARTDAKALVKSDICFLNSQQKEVFRSTARPIDKFDNNQVLTMPIRLKKKHILPGNKLTIRLNLTYTNIDDFNNKNNTPKPAPQRQLRERLEKFAILYRKDKCKDVVISVNGKNHLAHKVTLAAYSPIFASIFEKTPEKGKITQVNIPDVNEEAFCEILKYIKTGKLPVENNTVDLFILATEFILKELQLEVLRFMHDKYQWCTLTEI